MNKKLVLYDNNVINNEEAKIHKTRVEIKDHDTGETLFVGGNKVIIQGSSYIAKKLFGVKPKIKFGNYNDLLKLDGSIDPSTILSEEIENTETVCLYAVGTDGCGELNSQVYNVKYTKGIIEPIPFRYQLITGSTGDLSPELRQKYFGRKKISSNRVAYYFKAFETKPELKQQDINGNPITENVPLNNSLSEVETFVRFKLLITKDDFRDYFEQAGGGLEHARVNTISILTGIPMKAKDGYIYYQRILPLTKINFPNESLADPTKSLDIIYDIFE